LSAAKTRPPKSIQKSIRNCGGHWPRLAAERLTKAEILILMAAVDGCLTNSDQQVAYQIPE